MAKGTHRTWSFICVVSERLERKRTTIGFQCSILPSTTGTQQAVPGDPGMTGLGIKACTMLEIANLGTWESLGGGT